MQSVQTFPKRALTINEFIESYRLGRTKTYELINNGQLRSVVVGGRRLIPVDEAEKLIAAPESTKLEPAA